MYETESGQLVINMKQPKNRNYFLIAIDQRRKNISIFNKIILLQGMIYLHESPVKYHGALHTGNCLVDSRWVVKLADFGLREFKKGAEDLCLKDPNKIREKCYGMYPIPLLRLYKICCYASYILEYVISWRFQPFNFSSITMSTQYLYNETLSMPKVSVSPEFPTNEYLI